MFTSFTVALSKLWKWEILTTHQMLQLKWIPVCLERFWTRLWLLYFVFKILQANHVLSHIWKLKLDRNKQQRRSSIWPQLAFSHWKWIFIFCLSVTLKKFNHIFLYLTGKKQFQSQGSEQPPAQTLDPGPFIYFPGCVAGPGATSNIYLK